MKPIAAALILLACCAMFAACQQPAPQNGEGQAANGETLTIGVMPKLVGIDFFNATERGAMEAAEDLGIEVVFNGPSEASVEDQVRMLETWIAQRYDAIAVAPNDPDAIAPVLEKARKRGIAVVTWDADAQPGARDFFVNQCTAESVARTLMNVMARGAGEDADYVIVTGTLTAANQNIWMEHMEEYRQEQYPEMTNLRDDPLAPGEDQAAATQVTADALKTYPDLDGIFAITSVALPGAAEALRKNDAADRIFLTGLATPNSMREYINDGTVEEFVLWNPVDLGYLAVQAAAATAQGELTPGESGQFNAGRLGSVSIEGDAVILGDPIVFDENNIDDYDF